MKYCKWLAVTIVCATALLPPSAQAEDRALLVGVAKYRLQSPFRDLRGIDLDLAIMQRVARELGFEEHQIRVLADEEATLEGIREAFESWLVDAVDPGERALFYFSGHGYHLADGNGDEPDGQDEILVPHDYAGTLAALTNVVVDDEMESWIDRLRTDDLLVFLDACHSGSALKTPAAPAGDGWSMFDGDAAGSPLKGPGGGNAGYLALSAARDWEQAQATAGGSTFTIGIERAVREAAGSAAPLSMNHILDVAEAEIARAHPDKVFRPVLSGDLARADDELRRRSARSLWERLIAVTDITSRPIDISGVRSEYRGGDLMTFEVVMPVDGYLSVVTAVEDADDATVLFPNRWSTSRAYFDQGERVLIPPDDGFDLVMDFEEPGGRGDELNVLVVVVSDTPLDLDRYGVEAAMPRLDGLYRAGVRYVVTR